MINKYLFFFKYKCIFGLLFGVFFITFNNFSFSEDLTTSNKVNYEHHFEFEKKNLLFLFFGGMFFLLYFYFFLKIICFSGQYDVISEGGFDAWQRMLNIISKIDNGFELNKEEQKIAMEQLEWYKSKNIN